MDWFTIVLILIFFVFPIIQQILEAKKGNRPAGEDGPLETLPEDWRGSEVTEPVRVSRPLPQAPERTMEWSEGWGSWPGRSNERPEAPAENREGELRTAVEVFTGLPSPVGPPPRALPVPRAGVEEPAVVEIRSLHRANRVGRSRSGSEWHKHLALLRGARDPRELRGVIVLTEVLGKPKALKD
jgi:hypothetical protein